MKRLIPLLLALAACSTTKEVKTTGSIEKTDPALDAIISADAKIEVIGEGYAWSEGPVWVASENMLLFTDVPNNVVYKWTEKDGVQEYLKPSGFTGDTTRSQEPGANGLWIDDQGRLVLCQHGDRRLAYMNASVASPATSYTTIADGYQGKKFNSPNDVAQGTDKSFYITDPPYGLGTKDETDPEKQLPYQGVYKITPAGKVILLIDSITRPNGIGLSPDNKYLYIANSDPAKSIWYRYELGDTSVLSGSIFYDATNHPKEELGLPDGFEVDKNGNIYASGPGGVSIFNSEAKLLGKIKLEKACANATLTDDGKTLFITNHDKLLKVTLR